MNQENSQNLSQEDLITTRERKRRYVPARLAKKTFGVRGLMPTQKLWLVFVALNVDHETGICIAKHSEIADAVGICVRQSGRIAVQLSNIGLIVKRDMGQALEIKINL